MKSIKLKIPTRVIIKDGVINIERESDYQGQSKYIDLNNTTACNYHAPRASFLNRNIRTINLKVDPTLTENIDDIYIKNHACRPLSNVKKVVDGGMVSNNFLFWIQKRIFCLSKRLNC